ncbi:hypothetical protein ABIE77_000360 [Sinorhizobium fredii]
MLHTTVTQLIGQTPVMSIDVPGRNATLVLEDREEQSRRLDEGSYGSQHGDCGP